MLIQGELLLSLPLEGNHISDTCETNRRSITLNIQQIVYFGDRFNYDLFVTVAGKL